MSTATLCTSAHRESWITRLFGVSVSTLYNYMPDLEDLRASAVKRDIESATEQARP